MINIKHGPMLTQVIRAPIFWATHDPKFKEATKAIVSRMITIEVSRQFYEDKPIGAAAEAIKRDFAKPGEFVIATELPGVLNWAIAGLRRALERGSIEVTAGIKATADAIHRDSNLVAGFIEDCIGFDPKARIKLIDFCLAFSVWFLQEKGENRSIPSNDSIGKAIKAVGDQRNWDAHQGNAQQVGPLPLRHRAQRGRSQVSQDRVREPSVRGQDRHGDEPGKGSELVDPVLLGRPQERDRDARPPQ